MTNTLVTPNMGLTEPGIGNVTSPAWAALINADLGLIDAHDHTPGKGVAISSGSINVNADFSFNGYNLLSVNSLDFSGAVTGTPATLSIYSNGTDFFFKDINGNSIQLTKAGGPNAGTGNIQNLPSTPTGGAGISWSNTQSTFQFLADNGTSAANIDVATVVVRYPGSYPTPSGNFIALQAPTSLASGYSLTLPSLPASQKIMTLDAAGIIAAPYSLDNSTITTVSNVIEVPTNGITYIQRANGDLTQGGVASGSISSFSFTTVTGLSLTFTPHNGKNYLVFLVAAGTNSCIELINGSGGGIFAYATYRLVRDAAPSGNTHDVEASLFTAATNARFPVGLMIDTITGFGVSTTLTVQAIMHTANSSIAFNNVSLKVVEMV